MSLSLEPQASESPSRPAEDPHPWHATTVEETLGVLDTDPALGLTDAEVNRRLSKYGPNLLPTAGRTGPWTRFFLHFHNMLVYVLLAAGFVKLMLGLWVDASVILGVVVLNAILGFIQEGKAEKSLDAIRDMLSATARVLRGGETRMIPAEELVPGDVVLLESGDRIPADLRLVDVKNLRAEEAALTGESVPSDKSVMPVREKATVGDRESMAYSGTLVVSGRASGVVVATGAQTELGRINQMIRGVSPLQTPLLLQIEKFGKTITAMIAVVGAVTFAFGHFVRGIGFVEMFQAVTGIAVSMIPEGLPALITVTLALGVQRMAKRNAIVRQLPAVETLGSITRICSDKTGTLTLMEMMVVSAETSEDSYQISGDGYEPTGTVLRGDGQPAPDDPVLTLLGRVSNLCNDSELRQVESAVEGGRRPDRGGALPLRDKARFGPDPRSNWIPPARRDPVRIRTPLHGDAESRARRSKRALRQGGPRSDPESLRSRADPRRLDPASCASTTGKPPPTASPARVSASWPSPGRRTRPSSPALSRRRISPTTSRYSASSASSTLPARKRSKPSRNATTAASASP